ncbi:MAG: MMPL family transporter [Gammaproteobacteria bacterium]|nr:MMPL family transporter [Gammaproteobacteria bacterium]
MKWVSTNDRQLFCLVDRLAFTLLCLTGVVLLVGVFQWQSGWQINTDLRALLPVDPDDGLLQLAEERLQQKIDNKIILLLASTDKKRLNQAADHVFSILNKQSNLKINNGIGSRAGLQDWFDALKVNRFSLLTEQQRVLLLTNNAAVLVDEARRNIFNLQSIGNIGLVQDDPLGLFSQYITENYSPRSNIRVEGQRVFVNTDTESDPAYIVLQLDVLVNVFSLAEQESIVAAIKNIEADLSRGYPGVSLYKSGLIFHAAGAAETAKKEITLISIGSLIGVISLFLMTFRSFLPLILSLASVLFGGLIAFILCHAFFSSVHFITLVIGVTLIGVSIDYSLHYFAKCVEPGNQVVRFRPIAIIFSAIALSLTTSVLGYSSLLLAPLPGLQQVAAFSVLGLIFSWLFVVSVYPRLSFSGLSRTPKKMLLFALLPKRFWDFLGKRQIILIAVLACLSISVLLIANVQLSNDVRILHKPDPDLMRDEALIREVLNSPAPNQFFIVRGRSVQTVLEQEENFRKTLDKLVADGVIEHYQGVSQFVPSQVQQRDNYDLIADKLYFSGGPVARFMDELGFSDSVISEHLRLFAASKNQCLLLPEKLSLTDSMGLMWLGKVGSEYASIITLSGVDDLGILATAAQQESNILFVDKVQQLTHVIGTQQRFAALLLFVAYGVVMLMVVCWYRSIAAVMLVLVPMLSTLTVIAILTLLGQAISLFHLFAFFLVLGLGMDYSIFIRESTREESSSYVAILLSAGTSCLSFGLLSISSTPMVSHFGFVVLLGCLFNFVLAPLVSQTLNKSGERSVAKA